MEDATSPAPMSAAGVRLLEAVDAISMGRAQTPWRIWYAGEPDIQAQHAAFLNHEKPEAQWYCSKESGWICSPVARCRFNNFT